MKSDFLKSAEERTEKGIIASRWLLAPFYLGLVLSLFLLLGKFAQEFYKLAKPLFSQDTHHLVLGVLGFADILRNPLSLGSLWSNTLLQLSYIVIFGALSYSRFTSKDILS
jgi:uncharacterized protein (TIGR00645 family)